MKTLKKLNLIYLLFFLLFAKGEIYCQILSNEEIEKLFYNDRLFDLSFTDNYIWAFSIKGLVRISNNEKNYYKIDTNSTGTLSSCLFKGDSTGFNYHYSILPACNKDVWIYYYNCNTLLKINDDSINNYRTRNSNERLRSYFVGKDGIPWFHFSEKDLKDSIINYVYSYENKKLILHYTFITWSAGESEIFFLNSKPYIAEHEYVNNIHYYSIYKLDSINRILVNRFIDSDQALSYSSHYVNNDTLFVLSANGELYSIDQNGNLFKYVIKLKRTFPQYKFYIIDNWLIVPSQNKIVKVNILNGKEKYSEDLTKCDSCERYLNQLYLYKNKYIYCNLSFTSGNGTLFEIGESPKSRPKECEWNRVVIKDIDF